MQHNLSMRNTSQEPEPETEPMDKDIEILFPVELQEGEPIGNMYRERLADPVTRTMDYTQYCILNKEEITRKECKKHELLAYLGRKYRENSPENFEKGLPGPDLMNFMSWSVECRTCILYRCAPGSPENYREGGLEKATTSRTIWGIAGLSMVSLWTYAIGTHVAGMNPLLSAILATVLGALTFVTVGGRLPASHHAHGQREANSSSREGLRSRAERSPEDHEGVRYREVDVEIPSPSSTPAGAIIEGKDEPSPSQATAPPTIAGGNSGLLAPELRRENPVQAVKVPQTVTVVPAHYAEPKAPVLPVKKTEVPKAPAPTTVEVPRPPAPGIPPKTPRQPSKKVPAKKAEADPPEPKVEGFPCDHPGCGKVCKTAPALKSHKLTHRDKGKK